MKGYSVIEEITLEPHIRFLRINPVDLKLTLKNILDSLMNLSWINNFDEEYRLAYTMRAEQTVKYIKEKIDKESNDNVTSSSGELIVSELARLSVVEKYSYLDVPLADLFKKKKVLNHGFDFYTENSNKNILFGEAKYVKSQASYGNALKQINKFNIDNQHITDLPDIRDFFCKEARENCNKDEIGFMVAFSAKGIDSKLLIKNIKANLHYNKIKNFKEIILIAVNI